jgi:Lrp/AsnC family transcriptional regulator for asnA, asnC and gidA
VQLDELDRKLIEILQEDARIPNAEIAERVGSSEPTVRRRVDRLIREQIIKVVAVAQPFRLGYDVVAIVGIQTDHRFNAGIERELEAMPEIRFAGVTLGMYDMVIEAWFSSNEELRSFLHDRLFKIEGVTRTESLQVLKMIKYTYDWGIQPTPKPPTR